jgi:sugar/nucleoside kinase (ribokinase family)
MVNTTGGGDAVMAALIWAHLHGKTLEEATAAALKAGRIAVEYDGANNPALNEAAIEP